MIDLHAHSTCSFLDGSGRSEQITEKLTQLGRKAAAITDHGNCFVHAYFSKDCIDAGIRPIFGCEMYMVPDIREPQRHKNHLTVLASNVEGYRNLMSLITASFMEDVHYYKPNIDFKMLEECSEGLIVFSGCISSILSEKILENDIAEAVRIVRWFKEVFDGRFYLEVLPIDIEETYITAPVLRAMSKKLDIPLILTNDVHYVDKGNEKVWKILSCIRDRMTFREKQHDMPSSCYYMEDDEAWQHAQSTLGDYFTKADLLEMFNNQEKIAAECNVEIPKTGSVKYCDDPFPVLKQRSEEGLQYMGLDRHPEYVERLGRELDLISRKNFADYFLVVDDIVDWAKANDVMVGPCRGSAGCCLTAYVLGITGVDPIEHDLVMERFMSEDRIDPPDIDLDFQSDRRPDVIKYVQSKFGWRNVAHFTTFSRFKGRSALREVGKVFEIPMSEVERVQQVLIERSSADARASNTIEDTFVEFRQAQEVAERYPEIKSALLLEDQFRHSGVNAAGLVVSSSPLVGSMAFIGNKDDVPIASIDIYTAGQFDLLKMDILGIDELGMLRDLIEETGVNPELLAMDDELTLDLFNTNGSLGVFQFGATGTASVLRQIRIDSFDDLILVNSLSRPGPLHTGNTEIISKAKKAGTRKEWELDIIDSITASTYGMSVFQEQVLRICKEVGGMNDTDVASIRNAMSKSLGDEFFNKYRAIFNEGACRIHGITEEYANHIFDHISTFGSYGFNKSHSTGYALIAYRTAWFKAHYPRLFYKTLCNHNMDNPDKLKALLREYIDRDFGRVLPPKVNKSGVEWALEGDDLRAGLLSIVPQTAAEEIVSLYPIVDESDLEDRAVRRAVNSRVWNIINDSELFTDDDTVDVFGLYEFAERMRNISDRDVRIGDLGFSFDIRRVTVAGVMDRQVNVKSLTELEQSSKLKDWRTRFDERYGDEWAIIYLQDETNIPINIHIKNYLYPSVKDMLWRKKVGEDILCVKGLVPPSMNYVIAEEIWEWNDRKVDGGQCYKCPLIKAPFVPPCGNENADIFLIGMAPGWNEVQEGKPFVGRAGEILDSILNKLMIDRDKDLWIDNSILCRSVNEEGKNRDPDDVEIECCGNRLKMTINRVKPKVVIPLGKVAYKALTGENVPISEVAGARFDMDSYVCIPTFHPASALYSGGEKAKSSIEDAIGSAWGMVNGSSR